jgi:FeS assembly SUF system regulator
MLRVSKLTDYATVVMGHLALASDQVHSAAEVAHCTGIALPTTSKVLKALVRAGLLRSARGQGGGYSLARPAEQISVAQIVRSFEGPVGLTECGSSEGLCVQESVCSIRGNWQRINRLVLAALEAMSLADMIRPVAAPIKPYTRPPAAQPEPTRTGTSP